MHYLQPISDYQSRYDKVRNDNFSLYHGYAYDGTWLMAKLLQTVTVNNRISRSSLNKTDFINISSQADFNGVTVRTL